VSLASSRLSLTHRCTIERDTNAGPGADGWENAPDWQPHIEALPCRAWTNAGREVVADKESVVVVEDMRILVALGTDVTEHDRLGDVTYRGDVIFPGPTGIRAVLHRKDHVELVLVKAS
jgi:hypothetical protein